MGKELFKKGSPIDEKRIGYIELIITRMLRRLHKTTTAIVSPLPISTCATGEDVRGDILKCMMFKGRLGKCLVTFNEKPRATICIEFKALNKDGGVSRSFYTNVIRSNYNLDIDMDEGSLVAISVHPLDDKYKITEVWIALQWTPDISETKKTQYLIDNLEKVAESNARI